MVEIVNMNYLGRQNTVDVFVSFSADHKVSTETKNQTSFIHLLVCTCGAGIAVPTHDFRVDGVNSRRIIDTAVA